VGLFISYLIFSIDRQYQSAFLNPALFYSSGLIMAAIGVFLFLYLSARVCGRASDATENPLPPEPAMKPLVNKKRFPTFLFPLLAAAVIFWTNSFTERLFVPVFHLPGSFHFTNVAVMLALPALGFLADRYWQKFFKVFIVVSSCVFLLSPSLLLFTRSEIIFFVLYTINSISILLIVAVFPFAVLDLYWQENRRGYWACLLAISVHLFRVFAASQISQFRSIPINNGYVVMLLALAVIVFCALSYKLVKLQNDTSVSFVTFVNNDTNVILAFNIAPEESFHEHGLSKRETEIGYLLLQGMTNNEIAQRQYIEESTVKKHIKRIFDKYQVKRRTEFMAMFLNGEGEGDTNRMP
jgi:DNA-binding CsgD family transcriptional regulator